MDDLAFKGKLFTQILLWRGMYSRLVQFRHLYDSLISEILRITAIYSTSMHGDQLIQLHKIDKTKSITMTQCNFSIEIEKFLVRG
jgi:hypothetical protein